MTRMVALVYNKKGPSALGQSNWREISGQATQLASFAPSDDLKEPYFMFLILARQPHTLGRRRPKSFILISRRLIV
jgi:hypothetical protein